MKKAHLSKKKDFNLKPAFLKLGWFFNWMQSCSMDPNGKDCPPFHRCRINKDALLCLLEEDNQGTNGVRRLRSRQNPLAPSCSLWCWRCKAHICDLSVKVRWANCLIIHAAGGGETNILFSAHLGICCFTECNLTRQKLDPKHVHSSLFISLFLLCLFFSKLHYITTKTKRFQTLDTCFQLAQSRFWSLIWAGRLQSDHALLSSKQFVNKAIVLSHSLCWGLGSFVILCLRQKVVS